MYLLTQIFTCLENLHARLYVWDHMHTLIDPEA
jgi:hypothetical protein